MQLLFDVQDPIPANVNSSYGNYGFYKFGVMNWQYLAGNGATYDGPVHFINLRHTIIQPEYPNPTGYHYWFQPGVSVLITPEIVVRQDIPDVSFNATLYNPVSGRGMPPLIE